VPTSVCSLPSLASDFTSKPRGRKDFTNFEHIPLYDDRYYSKYCPINSPYGFSSCSGPLSNVKIFTGLNIEESIDQSTMKYTMISTTLTPNNSFISRFTGHIFAIPNSYINCWGQTFDFVTQRRYLSGRCADLPEKPIYPIESMYREEKTLEINSTVLNLVIPWSFVYGHEVMEILGALLTLKPLLQTCGQQLQLIGFHDLSHSKLYPLFEAAGLQPKQIKFISLYQREQLVHASHVLVPVFPCLYIPQVFVSRLRTALRKLPFPTEFPVHNGIVLHDRRLQKPQRDVPEGREIEAALRARYNNNNRNNATRPITVLYGSETLAETIKLMREASVFISVHSSATANMIFMRSNTTYVEISPRYYNFDCMLGMAYALGMRAYDYEALSGKWQSSAHVNLTVFLPRLFEIIDMQDQSDLNS
jgi:hypothetical protein